MSRDLLLSIACLSFMVSLTVIASPREDATMIPMRINQMEVSSFQVDVMHFGEKEILSIRASELILAIEKLHKRVPENLLERRQDKLTLEELSGLGFYAKFDEEAVEIILKLPLDKDDPDKLSIGPEKTFFHDGQDIGPPGVSGYLNISSSYGFHRSQDNTVYGDPATARLDSVLNVKGYVLEASGAVRENSPFARDDIRVTKEIDALGGMRVSAGDLYYPVLGYQTYRKLGGLSAYTIRDQKQGFLSSRASEKQIIVKQPSTLTFFVNEQPVATRKVLPGIYDINDIPMTVGVNRVRVLVEAEGSGQREDVVFDDYFSDYGIKKGNEDLAIAVGEKSTDRNGARSYHSENQTLLFNHRYDLTNKFSLSEYFEGDGSSQIGGMIEAFHVEGGYIQFDSALSNWSGALGVASRVGYYKTRPDEFYLVRGDRYNLNVERKFSGFSTLDIAPVAGQSDISIAYTFPSWKKVIFGVGGSYGKTDFKNIDVHSYSASGSRAIGGFYSTVSLSETKHGNASDELSVGFSLSWTPSERSYYVNTVQSAQISSTNVSMNTSSDQDVKGSLGQNTTPTSKNYQAQVTGTSNRQEITFSGDRSESRTDGSYVEHFGLNTRFGVAFAGSKFGIGRPISDSFFLTDTMHDSSEYRIDSWGRHSETGPFGEALVGFDNYQNNNARVTTSSTYTDEFDEKTNFNVSKSWRQGYVLKVKSMISPTVIDIRAPDSAAMMNTMMSLENQGTLEKTEFFVSSDGQIFLEGVECGTYSFRVGRYKGIFVLDAKGGRRILDLN